MQWENNARFTEKMLCEMVFSKNVFDFFQIKIFPYSAQKFNKNPSAKKKRMSKKNPFNKRTLLDPKLNSLYLFLNLRMISTRR